MRHTVEPLASVIATIASLHPPLAILTAVLVVANVDSAVRVLFLAKAVLPTVSPLSFIVPVDDRS